MTPVLLALLKPLLEHEEGRRRFPYTDTVGKLTIGIGRNLTDNGISDDEIDYLLMNDIRHAETDARLVCAPVFDALTTARQAVMIDMSFNLGLARLTQFRNMLRAVKEARYTDAANEMRSSLWATQVGQRAIILSGMMEKG